MAGRNTTQADAVVTALNQGSFALTCNAVRRLLNLEDLQNLKAGDDPLIAVSPAGDKHFAGTRTQRRHELTIHVAIAKKFSTTTDPKSKDDSAELDTLIELGEQIADFFAPDSTINGLPIIEVNHEPIYDEQSLRTLRAFLTLISVTFQTFA